MTTCMDRRAVLKLLLAEGILAAAAASNFDFARAAAAGQLGAAETFAWNQIVDRAKREAAGPFVPPVPVPADAGVLDKIDYDAYQQIRYRPSAALNPGGRGRYPVQLFHMGKGFREAVRINVVEPGGKASREVRYSASMFDIPDGHPARSLPDGIGFAGFRVMDDGQKTDWVAFLSASYFRTSGPYNQYGLSARGLAIDTGLPTPEEFPRFKEFWLEAGARGPLTVYALLDSPSCAGAYRFEIDRSRNGADVATITMEITAELFARRDITRLGIAPFSSMFWYGEASRKQAADWRPEIHDSDGLAIETGSGERIWRPLNNPPTVMTNAFMDRDPKGFGLLQRDRDFVHYLDDGVFYERRASTWVEPLDPWGEGAVHLLEIPTDDEIHDNIAAYWCPAGVFRKGEARRYRYRLSWLADAPFPGTLARATGTWTGTGGRPGHKRPAGVRKFVIDFEGNVLDGLGRDDGVEFVVTPARGRIANAYAHPVVDQRGRWRAIFDLETEGAGPLDIRAYLSRNGTALTETWLYQYFADG
ncbi:MAG: glucan biosynthesis protein [Hyphomicrobium sp.]|nr:glucan biosynthesis protein [Hyphomicrobium sp.]